MIERSPRAPVLRGSPFGRSPCSASSVNSSRTSSISNSRWYCLTSAFFGLVRMSTSAVLVEIVERRDDRQAADEFRDQPEFQQILRLEVLQDLAGLALVGPAHLGAEADRGALPALRDDLFEPGERAAADEQDVGGVDLQEFLLRVLAPALRRHRGDRALHDLQERLLHALARHVAGDRRVVGFARDLVDLVDIDDAALRPLDIVVGRLQQLQDDVLDILADIAGLGQRSSRRPS